LVSFLDRDAAGVTSFSRSFCFQVTANDTGSQMSGWLQRRSRRSWKRLWFVLKEQVLYVYKASEDVVALESIPVLGYAVEPMKEV
jgi:FYVE/RhoGEF/PH domain-containing protein 5/6